MLATTQRMSNEGIKLIMVKKENIRTINSSHCTTSGPIHDVKLIKSMKKCHDYYSLNLLRFEKWRNFNIIGNCYL